MEHNEILKEMDMDYPTLVDYLKNKYGFAKYDYFINESCRSKNRQIVRTTEGLFCHHIDEDKGYNLGNSEYAKTQPFEYQKAERLVYCNYLEHLLLHIQIGKDRYWEEHDTLISPKEFTLFIMPGTIYICSDLNDLYDKNGSSIPWKNRCFEEIENNFDDYIYILKSFIEYISDKYTNVGCTNKVQFQIGQHIRLSNLGDGIITKIIGNDISTRVKIKFKNGEKLILKNVLDTILNQECFDKALILVKKKLSTNWNQEIVRLIYEKL